MMTDPTIPLAAFDTLDRSQEPYPSMRQFDDGIIELKWGGNTSVSYDQGRTWCLVRKAEPVDCGSADDGSGLWIQPPTDPDPARDPDAIGGWWHVDCDSSTPTLPPPTMTWPPFPGAMSHGWRASDLVFEADLSISDAPFKSAEPLPTVWWYRREGEKEWTLSTTYPQPTEPGVWEIVGCVSSRVMALAGQP